MVTQVIRCFPEFVGNSFKITLRIRTLLDVALCLLSVFAEEVGFGLLFEELAGFRIDGTEAVFHMFQASCDSPSNKFSLSSSLNGGLSSPGRSRLT